MCLGQRRAGDVSPRGILRCTWPGGHPPQVRSNVEVNTEMHLHLRVSSSSTHRNTMPKATKASKTLKSAKSANLAKKSDAAAEPRKASKGKGKAVERKLYGSFLPIQLAIPSVLPITSSSSAASSSSHSSHTIFIRPDKTKTDGEDDGRKLFVANLPVDITERDVRVIFGRWGVIEDIEFTGGGDADALEKAVIADMVDEPISSDDEDEAADEDAEGDEEAARAEPTFTGDGQPKLSRKNRPRRKVALPVSVPEITPLPSTNPRSTPYAQAGSRCAHVTYLDALPVTRAMAHTGTISLDKYNAGESSGLQYYLDLYSSLRPNLASVKAFADSSMARFDHLQSMLLSSRAKKQGAGALVDEDGFTVVVRGGRYGRTGGRGKGIAAVGVASRGFKGDEKVKGKGAGELRDFYRFQQVDRKKKGKSGVAASSMQGADGRTRGLAGQIRAGQGKGRRDAAIEAVQAVLALRGHILYECMIAIFVQRVVDVCCADVSAIYRCKCTPPAIYFCSLGAAFALSMACALISACSTARFTSITSCGLKSNVLAKSGTCDGASSRLGCVGRASSVGFESAASFLPASKTISAGVAVPSGAPGTSPFA